ncbi:uncharacterized protein A4U43_C01F4450 [Asparagus officinalis]|uniref:Uncharacterized protein n=1 Tax=Asparagus officinalis TaxID=4686 RepID=A0A5P1FRF5_ASPOF|nr:uncharacterized protein LOC109832803 [Asparagus officinalis]ONK79250.1 uncharacterized protein A4U43_C01F4450 [Asparagus officinalis]
MGRALLCRAPRLLLRPESSIGCRSSSTAPDSSSAAVPAPRLLHRPPLLYRRARLLLRPDSSFRRRSSIGRPWTTPESDGNGSDVDKDKDDGRSKANKANKEEDDKMRTTTANVAARAAVGGMMYSYLHSVIFLS